MDNSLPSDIAALLAAADAAHAPPPAATDASVVCEDVFDLLSVDEDWWQSLASENAPYERLAPPSPVIVRSRSTACRLRQKAELVYLQQRVVEMESELQGLKDATTRRTGTASADAETDVAMAFWQRQAASERRARQQAIEENVRLRGMLEAQLRVARSLEKLLNRSVIKEAEVATGCERPRGRVDSNSGEAVFEELARSFDERYACVDAVMDECGLSRQPAPFEDARFVNSRARGTWYLEFVSATMVPFPHTKTQDVLWRMAGVRRKLMQNGYYEVVETSRDTVKSQYSIELPVRNSKVMAEGRCVVRRYLEEGRSVALWSILSTIKGGVLEGEHVVMQEEGWSVVSPVHGSEERLTRVHLCGRMRPNMLILPGSKQEEHVGLLSDILLGTYHRIMGNMHEHIGRMLLDDSLGL